MAYLRTEAGKHFLTDKLLGYAVGATVGVVVPQLHKKARVAGVSLLPIQGLNANGYACSGLLLRKQLQRCRALGWRWGPWQPRLLRCPAT